MSNTPTFNAPTTARGISDRMSEIGSELAKYQLSPHPNLKALVAEQDYLKSVYDGVLTSQGVNHT
jgi:hypothetical protein